MARVCVGNHWEQGPPTPAPHAQLASRNSPRPWPDGEASRAPRPGWDTCLTPRVETLLPVGWAATFLLRSNNRTGSHKATGACQHHEPGAQLLLCQTHQPTHLGRSHGCKPSSTVVRPVGRSPCRHILIRCLFLCCHLLNRHAEFSYCVPMSRLGTLVTPAPEETGGAPTARLWLPLSTDPANICG